jgi:hypothetical protein
MKDYTGYPEFQEFPKMARLSREVIVTEKIDGTNGQIFIPEPGDTLYTEKIYAGSRTKWLQLGDDNYGFASWVYKNQEQLVATLGPGRHFGEWWGSGIQRGYGLIKGDKRFSLFNVSRWTDRGETGKEQVPVSIGLFVVPTLGKLSEFEPGKIRDILNMLAEHGSVAAAGFMRPEGIITWHVAANLGFKKTILNDESPKSKVSE